ncbi:MAG: phosphoglucosamine mutase [Flavobacteriaceae bacterium]|jgi:phosphomannomutase|nr:phosphoglucosamine mutase [Flavobacteriaceae bacterium]MBT4112479.1 phosphoglucosamine mutase [Flavobacteriaceae bacterium]MBT4614333.1 phosphoglucosamine mutase [Flavobacteriaceae bacterium]MBT5246786.1 phosphoglucosamine mutase [Flavobacteriaceae bacterium]MBT5649971.1 phosphoglucosamine mutase [Flavobacteriaceae bacterium]
MPLIKSISGIRGTIGERVGEDLTPQDIVLYTTSYALWVKNNSNKENNKIVVGRDARISGEMVQGFVINTLISMGFDVVSLNLSTTPTVEIAVPIEKADGGIIITASHNPMNWNALKLLNSKGEFLSSSDGEEVLKIAETYDNKLNKTEKIGKLVEKDNYIDIHIDNILKLNLVDIKSIKKKNYKIVVDAVNSTGGIAVPKLLKKLGVDVVKLYCDPTGEFPHNPEPLKENIYDLSNLVIKEGADLGIVVDPDVDRLAFVCENGDVFGEEYTLVACSDYVLSLQPGSTVSNLSSTRALKDISNKYNCEYNSSAVGEVNVVEMMKKTNAIIGGEGNGGIILPQLHYGRDALLGIALFLSHLSNSGLKCSDLRKIYPNYFMSKKKIEIDINFKYNKMISYFKTKYSAEKINLIDGLKIDFSDSWVQLRKSNTEPIIRIYSEAKTQDLADNIANKLINEIEAIT